jgi:hypothetical protein
MLETNARYHEHLVAIADARQNCCSLDVEGFVCVDHSLRLDDCCDSEAMKGAIWPEVEALVGSLTGASQAVVFDQTVRRQDGGALRLPIRRVHNDFTEASGPRRAKQILGSRMVPEGANWALINVWVPLRHAIISTPLCLCDARSVKTSDLVAADIEYPGRSGEIYEVIHSETHLWSYFPCLRPAEALVFKCYDTRVDRARFTPHSAFDDPMAPVDAPPRESVEFRVLAVID